MTQNDTLFLATMAADALQAAIIDEVNDSEMYVGYCSPDCTGYNDPKWFIKRIFTDDSGKRIFYSNGSKRMNCRWIDRKNGKISYAPTEAWKEPETPQVIDTTENNKG
ncbi:MAG: hypothetical protein IKR17_01035 [Bacteroidales bacterium]|nr:hypothetical protein [Bacteroidales bacterium]